MELALSRVEELERAKFNGYFSFIEREGKHELYRYLEEINFFKAPCSSQYHLAVDGGLLRHSTNVAEMMFNLYDNVIEGEDITRESLAIVSLFHDLGKANYYNKPNYVENILKSGNRSEAKPFETNKERLSIPHEVASIHMLSRFIELTEEETFAILYHNGLYTPTGSTLRGNERQLQTMLHFADLYSSRFTEERSK